MSFKLGRSLGLALCLCPALALGATAVSGEISSAAVWTAAGSPYTLTGEVTVTEAGSLTIEPGVVVQGLTEDAAITARGKLTAVGTPAEPIVFTSDLENPQPNDWVGVQLGGDGSIVEHAVIAGAYRALHFYFVDEVTVRSVTLHDSITGLYTYYADGSEMVIEDIIGFGNVTAIVLAPTVNEGLTIDRCFLHDNDTGLRASGAGTATVSNCTIVHNTGAGVSLNTGDVVRGSVIALNGGAGVASQSFYSHGPTLDWCVVWGNAEAFTGGGALYSGTRTTELNPLFVDAEAGDYRPTHRSPLRFSNGDGEDVGYFPYDGVESPPGLHGMLWEDLVLQPGTHILTGDLVIGDRKIPGSGPDPIDPNDDEPPRLTLLPGAVLLAETTDALASKATAQGDYDRVELVNMGILEMDGVAFLPVQLGSAAAQPAPGDWMGVTITRYAFASNISEAVVRDAEVGITLSHTAHQLNYTEVSENVTGVWVDAGEPNVVGLRTMNNTIGLRLSGTGAQVDDVIGHDNEVGIQVDNLEGYDPDVEARIDRCLLYDNVDGIRIRHIGAKFDLEVRRCTITNSQDHGVYADRDSSTASLGIPSVWFAYSVVINSGKYGLWALGGGAPSISASTSVVFGNAAHYSGMKYDPVVINPLFRGTAPEELVPTSRSPLRCAADGQVASGYWDYEGDPTVGEGLFGVYHDGAVLTANESPYLVTGDLIAASFCSPDTTVVIEPGAELRS